MKYIITTVGTSAVEKANLNDITENYKRKKFFYFDNLHNDLQSEVNRIFNYFTRIEINDNNLEKFSAEIKSLYKLKVNENPNDHFIYLLCSDTAICRICAEFLRKFLQEKFNVNYENIQIIPIKHLQVDNCSEFQLGIVELINELEKIRSKHVYNIILNITGGFKATIPYLSLFGQINNIPIVYIFEETDEIITIPQSPVDITLANESFFERYHDIIEKLEEGVYDWNRFKTENNIDERDFKNIVWIDTQNNIAELNAIGKMYWSKYKNYILVDILPDSWRTTERRLLEKCLVQLFNGLNELIRNNPGKDIYNILSGIRDPYNHANLNIRNVYIYKVPNARPEIRIFYSFTIGNNNMIKKLKVYHYLIGDFTHSNYIDEFRAYYQTINNSKFVTIAISKNF